MSFDEILAAVIELLQREGRVSYRALKRRFGLDEEYLEDLKAEIIEAKQLAVDEQGRVLVWTGGTAPAPLAVRKQQPVPVSPPPNARAPQRGSEVEVTARLTPLVGREPEVGLLLERWTQAKTGQGQVVLLSGEPGIGKSRLLKVLKERVANEPHLWQECRCAPYYQHSALYPVIDLLQRTLELQPQEEPEEKLDKLAAALAPYQMSLPEVVPLFASLLSIPLDDRYPALSLSSQRQKQKTLEAIIEMLRALAAQQPVLIIVEDLQWVDPSTLELLGLLVEQVPTIPLYLVFTFRPEFHPPWPRRGHLTSLTLSRFVPTQVEDLVKKVAGGKALPPSVRQQVVAKAEGVPLFVEEMTKMVLESGLVQEQEDHYELTGPLTPLAIPTTLHDSLMARLEGLGEAKAVAQVGSVWGRGFTEEQLRAVVPLDLRRLERVLGRLVEADIFQELSLPPRVTYIFKHALIQDAAYASMSPQMRQQYHQQIAQVLERRFPETVQTRPELLAHHYTEAGLSVQALPYWQKAGQRAAERSANLEAISHLTKGLELLEVVPDSPERLQQELILQVALAVPLRATKGFTAPEVEKTYARALELCQRVEDSPQLFPVLFGLWGFYLVRAEYKKAYKRGEQLLHLAQSRQDTALLLEAHLVMGFTLFHLGELVPARIHLEQGIALYDSRQHHSLAFSYGPYDPGVVCLCHAAGVLWYLGYPERALKRNHEALSLAQELSHPFTLGYALTYAARLRQFRREGRAAQERAEAAIALAIEQGFPIWLAQGTMLQGWALAEQGQREEGISQTRQGLAAWQATGAEIFRSHILALLAEAYAKGGQAEEGLRLVEEALAIVERTEERFYEAELYRLKGELTLAQSSVQGLESSAQKEAEECFYQALNVARKQKAKSFELRAATSLSRLWQQQGKNKEARQLLEEIYSWFTEGFDTLDLQEAKALLAQLV